MEPFVAAAELILRVLPLIFFQPPFAFFFWLMVGFVVYQYRRAEVTQLALFGTAKSPALQQAVSAALYGIGAGLAGSFIFVFVGVALAERDILYLWPLALLLMLVHPRFICFAYAGGIVAFCSLLTGWPEVNVLGIMALVAILHLIEGILVALSGHDGATPVFVRRGDDVVGGFTMQRFWPLPVVIVLLIAVPPELLMDRIEMPGWWPLIPPETAGLTAEHLALTLIPVAAVLGYGDIAITHTPRAKARQIAGQLIVYSLVLLALTLLGTRLELFTWLAALFSPVAHEVMILRSRRREETGQALYVPPPRGVRILDVLPGSLAAELGLTSGDVILAVNDRPVDSRAELARALFLSSFYLELAVQREPEVPPSAISYRRFRRGETTLGVILVPEPGDPDHMLLDGGEGWLARLVRRDRRRAVAGVGDSRVD